MIRHVLGSRASIGGPLGSGRGGAAAAWYLAGGVSAANCVAAYQPIGAVSLSASYTNLANPGTYDASAPVAAPTFAAATGWTFNGSTQYLNSGIVPTNDQAWSMVVLFSGISNWGAFGPLAGQLTGSNRIFCVAGTSSSRSYYNGGNLQPTGASPGAAGTLAIAGNKGYWNGSAETGTIPAPSGSNTYPIWIGTLNNAGAFYSTPSKQIAAVAIYNTTLTAPQVAAISAAMAAL